VRAGQPVTAQTVPMDAGLAARNVGVGAGKQS
jgi:hypothetical protein